MPLLLALAAAGSISCLGIRFGMGFLAWACLPIVAITLFGVLDFVIIYGDLRPVEELLFAKQPSRWSTEGLFQAVGAAMLTEAKLYYTDRALADAPVNVALDLYHQFPDWFQTIFHSGISAGRPA